MSTFPLDDALCHFPAGHAEPLIGDDAPGAAALGPVPLGKADQCPTGVENAVRRCRAVRRPEAVPAFGDGERPDDVPIRRPYVPEERPGDYVPVSVEPCAPQVVVRDGFQTKEVLRVRLDEVLVVVDGGGDEYPLAARGVRDGREGRGGIDEVPFDPQVLAGD